MVSILWVFQVHHSCLIITLKYISLKPFCKGQPFVSDTHREPVAGSLFLSFPLALLIVTKLCWVNSATWWSVKETKKLYISTAFPLRQFEPLLRFSPYLVRLGTSYICPTYSLFSWIYVASLHLIVLNSLLFILILAQMPQKNSSFSLYLFCEPDTTLGNHNY